MKLLKHLLQMTHKCGESLAIPGLHSSVNQVFDSKLPDHNSRFQIGHALTYPASRAFISLLFHVVGLFTENTRAKKKLARKKRSASRVALTIEKTLAPTHSGKTVNPSP